jgi:hypothetical protein
VDLKHFNVFLSLGQLVQTKFCKVKVNVNFDLKTYAGNDLVFIDII